MATKKTHTTRRPSKSEVFMVIPDDDCTDDITSLADAHEEAMDHLDNNCNLKTVKIYKLVDTATRSIRFDSDDA